MIKKFISSPIDRVLNKKSRNAIENGAVAEAIEQIEADIERLEGLKASLTQAGNVRLSSATDVTDSTGLALPVTEKNPSIDGSLANLIAKYQKPLRGYSSFSQIPIPTGQGSYEFFYVLYNGSDENAPNKASAMWWWNGIIFGVNNRATQIAFSAFNTRNDIYLRQKHDNAWYGWYKITGTSI